MSSGGSWDPKKDLENLAKDPVGSILNAAVNISTAGTVGFENGKATKGVFVNAADEALGEVTGRNVARKQAMDTKEAVATAQFMADQDRKFAVQRQEATERQQSGMAGRQNAKNQGVSTTGSGVEQQMATQFLGL